MLKQITKTEYCKSLISGDCNLAVSSTIYKGNGEKEKQLRQPFPFVNAAEGGYKPVKMQSSKYRILTFNTYDYENKINFSK